MSIKASQSNSQSKGDWYLIEQKEVDDKYSIPFKRLRITYQSGNELKRFEVERGSAAESVFKDFFKHNNNLITKKDALQILLNAYETGDDCYYYKHATRTTPSQKYEGKMASLKAVFDTAMDPDSDGGVDITHKEQVSIMKFLYERDGVSSTLKYDYNKRRWILDN